MRRRTYLSPEERAMLAEMLEFSKRKLLEQEKAMEEFGGQTGERGVGPVVHADARIEGIDIRLKKLAGAERI